LLDAAGPLPRFGPGMPPRAPLPAGARGGPPSGGPLRRRGPPAARGARAAGGTLRDEASPALRRLRARLRELRRDLVKRLEGFFQQPGADALFQERYVTVRHGRYVLPRLACRT